MDLHVLTDLLEAITIFCFGLSWPISIRKSYVSRTAKGKSLFFEVFILIGYAVGITRKIIQVSVLSYPAADATTLATVIFYLSFFFYVFNFIAIAIDIGLYFRNSRLDKKRDESENK